LNFRRESVTLWMPTLQEHPMRNPWLAALPPAALGCVAALVLSAPTAAHAEIEIRQWEVPWPNTRPRDPYVAPDGLVWFVGQGGHYVASLDPDNGEFRRIDLEDGAGPHTVVVDAEGTPWYAGNRIAHIGRIDPDSGEITTLPTPSPDGRDPHTMAVTPEGNLWFTAQWGNTLGYLDTASGEVSLFDVPTEQARPYGLKLDSAGHPWAVAFGTHKLVTVDPGTQQLTEIDLPREEARPRRLEIDDQDRIWYVDYAGGYLGRYDRATGEFIEWRAPGEAHSRPYAMAQDAQGRMWFSETGVDPVYLVIFDPASESFVQRRAIPGGGGSIRHMYYDRARDLVWFGTDRNMIGHARLP